MSSGSQIDTNEIAWQLIHSYFKDNPNHITKHHIDSYNNFLHEGIPKIFHLHNPMKIMKDKDEETDEYRLNCDIYFGGEDGKRIYYGKPIIYEDDGTQHYMMPNEARLRNMTYGMSIHYDVVAKFREFQEDGSVLEYQTEIEKVFLGRFPIMLQSDACILKTMNPQTRYYNGECAEDPGGYFIIDGKEKVVVSQEKFADNVLNIKDNLEYEYSHSADIRTVSEDPSKPQRTLSVRIVAPTPTSRNGNMVVMLPKVRAPVPLFIVMRALGIESDKEIIQTCLLDMEKQENYVDLFIPSVHDANMITTQELALKYIASFTKYKTISSVSHILMDFFLPNVGDLNFKEKAIYLGYIVNRLLRVYVGDDQATDRDSFLSKRIELSGSLLYDLFTEYYKLQFRNVYQTIDKKYYYSEKVYQDNFRSLIETGSEELFADRIVERGMRKGFKGNWGSQEHTKRPGVTQGLNRLSFFSFISHLRKLNLPMDSSAKVVKPRLLHSTQWGVVCPVETPDGGNIGFHKHMTITAQVTAGMSGKPMKDWLYKNGVFPVTQIPLKNMHSLTKAFVNGVWIGVTDKVQDIIKLYKLYRRNGLISMYNSIYWNIQRNELHIQTDGGRLMRPILYVENGKTSLHLKHFVSQLKGENVFNWNKLTTGYLQKQNDSWSTQSDVIYEPEELYNFKSTDDIMKVLEQNKCVVELLDTAESEGALISVTHDNFKYKNTTHAEIHPSLILGVMGNMIVFPENNQFPRDLFSCGQGKQGVSTYHSNWQNRIDKMGVLLNYGQNPIVQSRYYSYITNDKHPYGENAIVAICAYNGYNVEDALIFNKAAIDRGLFRTTYLNMYEDHEENSKVGGGVVDTHFGNVMKEGAIGIKPGYDYAYLDDQGLIKENTYINDKMIVIGKMTLSMVEGGNNIDASVKPKKGQKGYVDKSFITEGEEGKRIAKVRIREERKPDIGDKLCSRAGQKGTVGIILPEEDMPFTKDGLRPDLIVNPHALPSRMTIGQLVECVMGKAVTLYGGYGDCTAYVNQGPKHKVFGDMLTQQGFHSSGNEMLMNGMSGTQLESEIFFGPTYYLRLKHMVKDKINYRATGPRTQMTRQTVHGRANDGGLRVGEMERDGILSHGMSHFLQESMLVRGDDYYMAVCNKTGAIAIYNEQQNIFLSPQADGPLYYNRALDGRFMIENKSVHGRDFSIVRVPYCFKLLLQELKTMNVMMRIITEDNVELLTGGFNDKDAVKNMTGFDSYDTIANEMLKVNNEVQNETTKSEEDGKDKEGEDDAFDINKYIPTQLGDDSSSPVDSSTSSDSSPFMQQATETARGVATTIGDTAQSALQTVQDTTSGLVSSATEALQGIQGGETTEETTTKDATTPTRSIEITKPEARGKVSDESILSADYESETTKKINELEEEKQKQLEAEAEAEKDLNEIIMRDDKEQGGIIGNATKAFGNVQETTKNLFNTGVSAVRNLFGATSTSQPSSSGTSSEVSSSGSGENVKKVIIG
jgi:DNA-directed RNA polymerase II subunit RPB2